MDASRWQVPPVVICATGRPSRRSRRASLSVSRSPTSTAQRISPASASRVRSSKVVLPDPGEDTRLSARMPRPRSRTRLAAAWRSFWSSNRTCNSAVRAMPGRGSPGGVAGVSSGVRTSTRITLPPAAAPTESRMGSWWGMVVRRFRGGPNRARDPV